MNDSDEPIIKKTSKINSGMLQVIRLNELWKDCHKHARSGYYSLWNDTLDRVWCELGGDVEENDDAQTNYDDLNLKYAKSITVTKEKRGFETVSNDEKLSMVTQKQALINKELFLRRLMNKQGKGTAYENEDEDDYD